MTRDEIRLVVFVLCAIVLGTIMKWWRERDPVPSVVIRSEKKSGWAEPPYVFKSKAVMEKAAAEVGTTSLTPHSKAASKPPPSR